MSKPAAYPADEFLARFPKLALGTVYVLHGEDAYQRDRILALLRKRVLHKGSEDFDLSIFYGDETAIGDVIDQLEMLPMLSERRLVIVKEFDKFTPTESKRLLGYIRDPAPQSVLILSAEKIDKRQALGKEIAEKAVMIECKPPRNSREVLEWLRAEISGSGVKVSPKALETFAQTVPLDYRTAIMEWDKLLLYIGKTDSITLQDIQQSLSQVRPVTIYDLQNAIGHRDLKSALDLLSRFMSQSESLIFVVALLNNFFQTIWRISYLRARKVADREITAKYLPDVYPTRRTMFLDFARNYPLPELECVFDALYQADSDAKSIDITEPVLGTIMLQRICQARTR
jgi:DNA polymerase III subunit delta